MSNSRVDNTVTKRSYRKYRRLPNGFGQISKVKGNLRNPYRAMVTVGKSPTGKPICKLLKPKAYFKTYNEAYQALMKYHEDPFDLNSNITCKELFERWSEQHSSLSSMKNYNTAWKYCSDLYDMEVCAVRAKHIKNCMFNGTIELSNGNVQMPSVTAQSNIKLLWGMMLDYAVEHDIISHNYARDFKMPKEILAKKKKIYKGHKILDDKAMAFLIKNIDNIYAEMAIVQCYMGWRPDELCQIKTSDVDLENMTIVGGSKTKAGKNRIVPIHPSLENIIAKRYNPSNEKLYDVYYEKYRINFKELLPDNKLHDCRKTFVTMAKKSGMDEYAIKRIVGHTIEDLTEAVYTERDIEWLKEEMSKIPSIPL